MNTQSHCPVCCMDIENDSISFNYQGMKFAFCSEQCQERFIANPHVYIGQRGMPSAKQRGEHIIKRRVLKLDKPVPDDIAQTISQVLHTMMGIKAIKIEGTRIDISYDLLEASAQQIEDRIEQMGEQLTGKWAEHLKRAFIHYLEETELDNLEHDIDSHHH